MTPEVESAIHKYTQWFGSYTRGGELKKVQVWLTIRVGRIEFLTPADSLKVKRIRRNPRVVSFLGDEKGPSIPGSAEIVTSAAEIMRVYRGYWKTHPIMMVLLSRTIKRRIETGKQVLIRITPDEPNPIEGITAPLL